jgi:hypothetical protein
VEYLDGPDHQIALKPRRLRVERARREVRNIAWWFPSRCRNGPDGTRSGRAEPLRGKQKCQAGSTMNQWTLIWCVEPTRNESGRRSQGTVPGLAVGEDQRGGYEAPGDGGAGRAKSPVATVRAMGRPMRGRRWFPDWGYEPAPHASSPSPLCLFSFSPKHPRWYDRIGDAGGRGSRRAGVATNPEDPKAEASKLKGRAIRAAQAYLTALNLARVRTTT